MFRNLKQLTGLPCKKPTLTSDCTSSTDLSATGPSADGFPAMAHPSSITLHGWARFKSATQLRVFTTHNQPSLLQSSQCNGQTWLFRRQGLCQLASKVWSTLTQTSHCSSKPAWLLSSPTCLGLTSFSAQEWLHSHISWSLRFHGSALSSFMMR